MTGRPPLFAQEITGSIAGNVQDASGAAVPNVKLTITNSDQNVMVRSITSDANGYYSVPLLPVAHYSISAEAPGFKKYMATGIQINANDRLTINLPMQVGNARDAVTVEANALQVETQSAAATGLISGREVRELTLNNRNYEQLVALMPGVSYGGGDQIYIGATNPTGAANTVSFSINGQRNSSNNWTIDGADNVDRGGNLTLLNYPSVEAIAEFKVLRGLYSAESGRAGAGQVNVITRSGTNRYHGDAYEFLRNDVLTANNYFNNLNSIKRPPLRYNDFGYTLGGPVPLVDRLGGEKESKTFFFFSQEYRRVINYANFAPIVATSAMKQGIFAHPVCTQFNAAFQCAATGTQIASINPVAQAYIKDIYSKIPDPQDPNTLVFQNTQRGIFNARQDLVRVDHTFSPKLATFFRYINDSIPTMEPNALFSNGAGLPGVSTTESNAPGRNYLGSVTWSATPTFLVEAGYAYSYGAITSKVTGLVNPANSPDIKVPLPFASTLTRVPTLSFAGSGAGVGGFGPYNDFNRDHNAFGSASKIFGAHTLKAGLSYHHYQKTENAATTNAGVFAFDNNGLPKTNASAVNNFEQAWANFLLGNVNPFTQADRDLTPNVLAQQWEMYAQDEWRLRPNLTLSYGARYSLFLQPTDGNNLLTSFDPATYDPAKAPHVSSLTGTITSAPGTYDPLNGIIVNGQNSPFGKKVGDGDTANIAPRFGVSWDPYGQGKTVLRAGYGLYYDSTLVGMYEQNTFQNPPFVNSISIPNTRLDNPTAGTPVVSSAPKRLHATPVNLHTPYSEQWSLDLQQEIAKGWLVDLGYYGSEAHHLLGIVDINEPLPGAYLAAGIPGPITSTTSTRLNAVRPFLGYAAIDQVLSKFSSNYHSLQASTQRQFQDGSLVKFNYTWSHALTNNQTDRSSAPENTYNIPAEYGPSQLDRRHIITANYVYYLPFFREQHGVVGHALGGWETSGIFSASTGLPLTVSLTSGVDPAGLGYLGPSTATGRPDMISDPNNGPKTRLQWFNTGTFTVVSSSALGIRAGNAPRGAVTGPGFWRWDASLFKNFKMREWGNLQFRADAFNVLNHTNWDTVSTSFTASTFGRITGARDPRIMQLALKFLF